ncbi:MAG: HNH endonuclease family protein [Candidatus Microsaccharimonas sp.]
MSLRLRRLIAAVLSAVGLALIVLATAPEMIPQPVQPVETPSNSSAQQALETLEVKGRAAKTGYSRDQFGSGWATVNGCDTRNIILNRDLVNVQLDTECKVVAGTLNDPYTGKVIEYQTESSSKIQIDHVVALSDAWQKGAQQLTREKRIQLANDPLELIAVDGPANQEKGDSDAASWLPSNKGFRCQYVARQIAIKQKYSLWVTTAEKSAMTGVLALCPTQTLPAR